MSKATKRQRQKERKAERLRIEARLDKRRKLIKGGAFLGAIILIVAAAFVITKLVTGDKKSATCASTKNVPAGSPALIIDPKGKYTANIETSEGTMVATLDACTQLWGANNFVTLANKGFYNNTTFHRAAKDFVIQGGDPKGDGTGGPGYTFVSELPAKGYSVGDLAWAKTGSDPAGSAGSQFFVITAEKGLTTFNAKPYQYGQFGSLTSGLDVARKIEALAPANGDGKPTKEVKITRVTIIGTILPTSTTAGGSTTTSAATTTTAKP